MDIAVLALIVALCVIAYTAWQSYSFNQEREAFARERNAFAAERREWAKERRELNTRIQAPEAAPYMYDGQEDSSEDDLPILPEFTVDEAELERARAELAEVGYEEGPAL